MNNNRRLRWRRTTLWIAVAVLFGLGIAYTPAVGDGLLWTLPYTGTIASNNPGMKITNNGAGDGMDVYSNSGDGVYSNTLSGTALAGYANTGCGVFGASTSGYGIIGYSPNGVAVSGSSNSRPAISGTSNSSNGLSGIRPDELLSSHPHESQLLPGGASMFHNDPDLSAQWSLFRWCFMPEY